MDSLILCKFLRGVFEDPFPEWARLLSSVTGWDVDGEELEATARRIVLAKRAFNAREGWTRADDGLPDRFLDESLEVGSGRTATPHPRAARRHDRGVLRGARPGPRRACSERTDADLRLGMLRARARSIASRRETAVAISTPAPTEITHRQPDDRRSRGHRAGGHDDLAGGEGRRDRDPRPLPRRALRPGRRLPHVRRRRRRARLRRAPASARARTAWRSRPPRPSSSATARSSPSCCSSTSRRSTRTRRRRRPPTTSCSCSSAATASSRTRPSSPRGAGPRRGPLEPGHRGQPRRLHPLRPLRPRLRRHPGQRRHRPLGQGLHDAHRVRPQRPDGRVVVRHLRRVRRRVPDGRAHQQADQRRPDPPARGAAPGRLGLPVLRRRLRADLQRRRRAQRDRLRRGPRRSRARRAACASRAATAGTTRSPSSA